MKRDFIITDNKLMQEWDWELNNELNLYPDQLTLGSNQSVRWKCPRCNHRWAAKINNRAILSRGCPECAKRKQKSSQEVKLYYYVQKYFPDVISGYKDVDCGITEIDIYIPSIRCGIEYDGSLWHTDIEKDLYKDDVCNKNNITLIRIREPKCPQYESNCIFVQLKNRSTKTLKVAFESVFDVLGILNVDIDFDRDMADIEDLYMWTEKENSLLKIFENVASEWHPTKNGSLTPDMVSPHSTSRVWWLCAKCGHEYITTVDNKVHYGYMGACNNCKKERIREVQSESVYCKELDKIFVSQTEASRQTGVAQQDISRCCNGNRKSAGKHPLTGEKLTWIKINTTK